MAVECKLHTLVIAVILLVLATNVCCEEDTGELMTNAENGELIYLRRVSSTPTAQDCPYSTCCFYQNTSRRIDCFGGSAASSVTLALNKIPVQHVRQIQLNQIRFYSVPDGFLGAKTFDEISIGCLDHVTDFGPISASALNGLTSGAKFELANCNARRLSFNFLASLPLLEKLVLHKTNLTEFVNFPPVPRLKTVALSKMFIENWYPPHLTPNLTTVNMYDNNEVNTNRILQSLTFYPNLENLVLGNNQLTFVPHSIASFTNLRELYLADNPISVITNDSLGYYPNLEHLGLHRCPIKTIEAGSFIGIPGRTRVYMWHTTLKVLNEEVFREPLEAMQRSSAQGSFDLLGVELDCPSHGWLVCDRRDLLPRIRRALCQGSDQDFQNFQHEILCSAARISTSPSSPLPSTATVPAGQQLPTLIPILLLLFFSFK